MPRLVRRAPLHERIQAYLNPWDLALWVSEELNSNDWDEFAKDWAMPLGVGLNIVFMIARANMGGTSSGGGDGVFADDLSGGGWGVWISSIIVYSLAILSFANAANTFLQTRAYRLFENPIDVAPSTPSAHRVRVDSSPSSTPLSVLQRILYSTAAESRAHPDAARHVWEVSVWNPPALCLQLFNLFSPGHVVVHYLFLPTSQSDPRPSVTVITTIFLAILLSLQLTFQSKSFTQKALDERIISKEVLHEYDTKFVHPTLNSTSRDVGIQANWSRGPRNSPAAKIKEVDTYTPHVVINRGFKTNPNPNYASQFDPDNLSGLRPQAHRGNGNGLIKTPANPPYASYTSTASTANLDSSPVRPSTAFKSTGAAAGNPFGAQSLQRSPEKRTLFGNGAAGDGGSLGVYSHANSPLRKAASNPYLRPEDRLGSERREREKGGSPLKRMSTPYGGRVGDERDERRGRGYGGLGVGRRESGRF